MNPETKKKIKEYFERLRNNQHLEEFNYSPTLEGIFQLIPAEPRGKYSEELFMKGRFIDAVGMAVNTPAYYGDWIANDVKNVKNCNNGYIKLVKPVKLIKDKVNLNDFLDNP